MPSLVSFTGAHTVAIKGDPPEGGRRFDMHDPVKTNNVIAIFEVGCIKSAQQQCSFHSVSSPLPPLSESL